MDTEAKMNIFLRRRVTMCFVTPLFCNMCDVHVAVHGCVQCCAVDDAFGEAVCRHVTSVNPNNGSKSVPVQKLSKKLDVTQK